METFSLALSEGLKLTENGIASTSNHNNENWWMIYEVSNNPLPTNHWVVQAYILGNGAGGDFTWSLYPWLLSTVFLTMQQSTYKEPTLYTYDAREISNCLDSLLLPQTKWGSQIMSIILIEDNLKIKLEIWDSRWHRRQRSCMPPRATTPKLESN